MADTLPLQRANATTGGQWAIQVGAFAKPAQAESAIGEAKARAREQLLHARTTVASVQHGKEMLYRARLIGLSREQAVSACAKVSHGTPCMVLPPDQT
jgi:hypothetical protein